jgi:hypothetical protein
LLSNFSASFNAVFTISFAGNTPGLITVILFALAPISIAKFLVYSEFEII